MVFTQGSRSRLSYVSEVTYATTPGSPTMLTLPQNTNSLDLTKASVTSGEIRSDRNMNTFRHGNKQVGGDIMVELRATDFDDLIQSCFFNAFSTGTLKNGTTLKSMTIEDAMLDITKYRVFTGCCVNTMDVSMKPNQIVTAKFGILGSANTINTSSLGSPTAASGNAPFDTFTAVLDENSIAETIVTGLDFKIDNQMKPTFVIGSAVTPQLEYGQCKVSGTMTCYFPDTTLLNKFINETVTSISAALTDGTNTYTFNFPHVKYSGGTLPLQNEQSRLLTLPFVAFYDSTSACSISLVKS